MRRVLGVVAVLMGSAILIWVAYNLLIETQPEARGRNPLPAIVISLAMIFVGSRWIRGKQAG